MTRTSVAGHGQRQLLMHRSLLIYLSSTVILGFRVSRMREIFASRLDVGIYFCRFQRQLKVRTWVGKAEMGDELHMGTEEKYTLNGSFDKRKLSVLIEERIDSMNPLN